MPRTKNYSTLSEAIEAAGLGIVETIPDGNIHRFETPADKHGQESGWYVDYGNGGAFGSWKTGEKHKYFNGNLSKADLIATKARLEADKVAREEALQIKQDLAAGSALGMWNRSEIATAIGWHPDEGTLSNGGGGAVHLYSIMKKIKPYKARIFGDWLVIPMYYNGQIVSGQKIDHDGNKRFFIGGRVKGCLCPIGKLKDVLYICEGYATGCSIHEYTGQPVAVAFTAGNLHDVAIYLRKQYPDIEIIIAADNDRETELRTGSNPGLEKASAVATSIRSHYIYPDFEPGIEGTDFNDYLIQGGELWTV